MRLLRFALMLALFLCGCGGSTRHTVETGAQGSLEGLAFMPLDHSRYVDIDTDPEIFWLQGYNPPSRFTVSLKRIDEYGDLESVNTKLERLSEKRWRLKVFGTLSEGTFYAVIVRDDTRGDVKEAWFMTRKSHAGTSKALEHMPKGAFEHTVTMEGQQ